MIEVFKNPVVLGVLSGILVYVAMAWRIRSNKNKKKKQVKIHLPIIIAILIGVIAHYYIKEDKIEQNNMFNMPMQGGMQNNLIQHYPQQYHMPQTSNLLNNNRFNGEFVTKGISIPSKIPEAFSTEHF